MDGSRQNRNRSPRPRENLDKRVDQWIETGRQFVDGVAGNRPGKRKNGRIDRRTSTNLQTVGRWVGDKIDWFLEETDDFEEPYQLESKDEKPQACYPEMKQPLEAISRRVSRDLYDDISSNPRDLDDDSWPDDGDFKVEKWKRNSFSENREPVEFIDENFDLRPLPRSTRRRN